MRIFLTDKLGYVKALEYNSFESYRDLIIINKKNKFIISEIMFDVGEQTLVNHQHRKIFIKVQPK